MPRSQHTLADALRARRNHITPLRLLLALLVLVSHACLLGGFGPDAIYVISNGQISLGTLAVAGFFFVSGLLITQSFLHCESVWRYLWHRALRILPGYWVCLLVTTYILGSVAFWVEYGSIGPYLYHDFPTPYIDRNFWLFLHQHTLGGLFAHNPLPGSFNESLWTLEVEARCYLAVALLGVLGILVRARPVVLLIAAGLWLLDVSGNTVLYQHDLILPHASYTVPSLYFALGAACYLYRERVILALPPAMAAAALVAVSLTTGAGHTLLPLSFCYLLLSLAFAAPSDRRAYRVDLSYGTYIYAFTLQQFLALVGLNRLGLLPYLGASIMLTLALAFLSWHFVEQRALRLKHCSFGLPMRWHGGRASAERETYTALGRVGAPERSSGA